MSRSIAFQTTFTSSESAEEEARLRRSLIWLAPAAITLIGFLIRWYRLEDLSLWLDEIYVVDYIQLSWRQLAGIQGTYDNHPPLYFLLVKLVALVADDLYAARILSLVTGTATIASVYLLVRSLVNPRAATLAALIVALSPLHIWYSQEGRMYAPTALAVTLSYYALAQMLLTRKAVWTVAYAISISVSAYLDYSAFYALIPHVVVVGYAAWRWGRQAARLWILAIAAAGLSYLPWIARVLESIEFVGQDREFLLVTRRKFVDAFFTIAGLPGDENYYWGFVRTPWVRWPEIRPTSAALVVAILFLSAATLNGRNRPAFVIGLSLLGGTLLTAAAISWLVSPGFADRTVLFAVIGWAILAGSAPFGRVPNGGRLLSLAAAGLLTCFSLAALWSVHEQGSKESYRDLAAATSRTLPFSMPLLAQRRPDEPVIADARGLINTALEEYQPEVAPLPVDDFSQYPAFWHVYSDYPWESSEVADLQETIGVAGYELLLEQHFDPVMELDLYARISASLGDAIELPEWTEADVTSPWEINADAATRIESVDRRADLMINELDSGDAPATLALPAEGGWLYVLSIQSRFLVPIGILSIDMSCLDARGEVVGGASQSHAPDDLTYHAWTRTRSAVHCPADTTIIEIAFRVVGPTTVMLRAPGLSVLAPGQPIPSRVAQPEHTPWLRPVGILEIEL